MTVIATRTASAASPSHIVAGSCWKLPTEFISACQKMKCRQRKQSGLFSCFVCLCVFSGVLALGGWIFSEFEGGNEQLHANQLRTDKNAIRRLASKYIHDADEMKNFTEAQDRIEAWLHEKQAAPDNQALNWNHKGGVFFMFTIMTTIGYGSFAPYTDEGQAAVIWLGFIGLIVGVVTLSTLGTNFSKLLDSTLCKDGLVWKKGIVISILTLAWSAAVAVPYRDQLTGDGYWDGLYYAFVTYTTIGFGDYVIDYQSGPTLVWWMVTVMMGLVLFAAAFECVTNPLTEMLSSEEDEDEQQAEKKKDENDGEALANLLNSIGPEAEPETKIHPGGVYEEHRYSGQQIVM